jgi:DNA mismatch endonuclease, patch repair protein
MALVKGRDTQPELAVRRALWSLGVRFRLHPNNLPGRPDIVVRRLMVAIFVHGCFWHRHKGCARNRMPKSRVSFWTKKFDENVARDRRARRELAKAGWTVVTIWECQTERRERLVSMLRAKLEAA